MAELNSANSNLLVWLVHCNFGAKGDSERSQSEMPIEFEMLSNSLPIDTSFNSVSGLSPPNCTVEIDAHMLQCSSM